MLCHYTSVITKVTPTVNLSSIEVKRKLTWVRAPKLDNQNDFLAKRRNLLFKVGLKIFKKVSLPIWELLILNISLFMTWECQKKSQLKLKLNLELKRE